MRRSVVIDLIEKAKDEGMAVEFESFHFDEAVFIEPEDEIDFHVNQLIVNNNMVIDLKHVALAKIVQCYADRNADF